MGVGESGILDAPDSSTSMGSREKETWEERLVLD